jgi:glyoxylase-like metal-dependent hydrolase (beta-lactamase superfamily II)
MQDYQQRPAILRLFQLVTKVPLDTKQAAIQQVASLGYKPQDIRHIVLTHMHFDHCGGLPDFPDAAIHVHHDEYEAFMGSRAQWTDYAYVRHHTAHDPNMKLYRAEGERWFGFDAIPLPLEHEMYLIPLFGHSRGHCGVAIRQDDGWLFHVADAAPIAFDESLPQPVVGFVLGPHTPRLREFREKHQEISMTTGHMWLDFFEQSDDNGQL